MGSLVNYGLLTGQIRESWAIGVEWLLSHIEYAERGINNYGEWSYHPINAPIYPNDQAYQYWTLKVDEKYTSLFINIIDNINDNTLFFEAPDDQLTGYTLSFIEENLLPLSFSLDFLKIQLKNTKPAGVTDAQIDLLFSSY
jgi:hypothetical protein